MCTLGVCFILINSVKVNIEPYVTHRSPCAFNPEHHWKQSILMSNHYQRTHHTHKKVLLRERKRHTARRVASTPLCCPNWVPPPASVPPQARVPPPARVHPPARGPPLGQGTPPGWTCQGTPPPGYPPQPGYPPPGYPPSQGTPPARVPPLAGPGRVSPQLPHGILGNVAKHYGIWVPPPVDRQKDRHVSKHYLPSYYVRGR